MRQQILCLLSALFGLFLLPCLVPAAYDLYWTESDRIMGSDIDGENVTVVFDGSEAMAGIAVDILVTGDHIYWTDHPNSTAAAIWRAGRDGSNPEKIAEFGNFRAPHFFALDEPNGHIYFTDFGRGIFRIDLDGSNEEWVFNGQAAFPAAANHTGIYLRGPGDPVFLATTFTLYEPGGDEFATWATTIANLPGTGASYGIVHDEETQTVYYTTFGDGRLHSYNLVTGEEQVLSAGLIQPLGLKFSPSKSHLLIAERGRGVSAYQLDNRGYDLLVASADAHFGVAVTADPADLPPGEDPGGYEPLAAPFMLDFGSGEGKTGLGPLLIPERFQDWSVQEDAIRYASVSGGLANTAAVIEVENYEQGQDFFVETEVTMVEMGRDWFSGSDNGWQRFGFALLGGPHTEEEPFSQDSVGYKLLMMRGQLRLNDHGVGIITRENWNGAFENGAVYRLEGSGVFDELGRLVLTFTVTDHNGHSQTIATDPIENPHHGNLFGLFGRDQYEVSAPPAYDYDYFSMAFEKEADPVVSWPFHYTFGTEPGRDSAEDFVQNIPGDWSLEARSLRLTTAPEPGVANSLNTTRVIDFTPGDDFVLRAGATLDGLASGHMNGRAALVLLGDREGFDPDDDDTYYTFQWLWPENGEARIAVRRGMDGDIVAQAPAFAPAVGERCTFDFRGYFNNGDDLDFVAALTGESGGGAVVSGTIDGPLAGKSRFGFGGRHAPGGGESWDFHDFAMMEAWTVDYEPLHAPFALDFGEGAGRVGLAPLLVVERPQDWSEQEDAIRFASRAGSPGDAGSWTSSAAMAVVENYQPWQGFSLESEMTAVEIARGWTEETGNGWQRFGFSVLGGPHSPENPLSTGSPGYNLLMVRGELRILDVAGGTLASETWNGVYENGAVYALEASGAYDEFGRLRLTFTVTDNTGHSQTLNTDWIQSPQQGNTFGIFGRDRYDADSPPAYDFHSLTMSVDEVEPPEPQPPVDPVAYWSFDTDFSATAGGPSFDGSPVNGAVIDPSQARFGNGSARFEREQVQYVEIDNSPIATHHDFSYAAWYYLDLDWIEGTDRYFVLETAPNWSISYGLRQIGGEQIAQVFVHDDAENGTSRYTDIPAGEHRRWRHIAVNYHQEARSLVAYLDGKFAGSVTLRDGAASVSPTDALIIGAHRAGARNWQGWIDDVAVWNRTLSAGEIAYLQQNPVPAGDLPVGEGFAAWQEANFPGETDPAIVGPGANPAGDGIGNLVKYALGLDPTVASRDGLPAAGFETIGEDDYLTLAFSAPDDVDDVFYTVVAGSDPGDLDGAAEHVSSTPDPERPGHSIHLYRDTEPVAANSRRFMKLSVELQ